MTEPKHTPVLSLVIPLYKEEQNIAPLVKDIQESLQNLDYELILVDDGSNDNTYREMLKYKSQNVHLIQLRQNFGQALALAAGIDFATGEHIATMDGDLQNKATDLIPLLHTLQENELDFVTGIRAKRQDIWLKKFPSLIANALIRKTTGLSIKDHGCGIKVMTAKTAKGLNLYADSHRYIALIAHLQGARIGEIPVTHSARQYGESKYGLERTFKVISDIALILFQRKYFLRPIHFFGNLGLVSFLGGFAICLYLVGFKFITQNDIGGRPLLMLGILLVLVGIQFFTMGILLDLGMRTYFESQNKKPYEIREVN